MNRTTVWATTSFVALHAWPDAPGHRKYLASPHRHLFLVKAAVNVTHDNRDVEFHDLLEDLASAVGLMLANGVEDAGVVVNLGARSCEMMAREIGTWLTANYGNGLVVEVSEDGEFGATVSFDA